MNNLGMIARQLNNQYLESNIYSSSPFLSLALISDYDLVQN